MSGLSFFLYLFSFFLFPFSFSFSSLFSSFFFFFLGFFCAYYWRENFCRCRPGLIVTARYALAADIQTIPGLPTAPGYLNVDVDPETGEIDGLF